MRNLKITAHLTTPLAGDPPHLDALLVHKENRWHHPDRARPAPPQTKGRIPLSREWLDGWYVSRVSSPILGPYVDQVAHYNRRTPTERAHLLAESKRTVVATGNSWTKNYRLPLRVRSVRKVVWFAVGNGSPMRKILRKVTSIGKKTSYGYGVVSKWDVEQIDADWSWFAPMDGQQILMRPMPLCMLANGLTGYRQTVGACVPPYWHPERFTEILIPC